MVFASSDVFLLKDGSHMEQLLHFHVRHVCCFWKAFDNLKELEQLLGHPCLLSGTCTVQRFLVIRDDVQVLIECVLVRERGVGCSSLGFGLGLARPATPSRFLAAGETANRLSRTKPQPSEQQ